MGIKVFESSYINNILKNKKYTNELSLEIYFNNASIALFDNDSILLPQKSESTNNYHGRLSIHSIDNDIDYCIAHPHLSKEELMYGNDPLTLYIYTEEFFTIRNLYFTTLPVIQIETEDNAPDDVPAKYVYSANFTLSDYQNDTGPFENNTYTVTYHRRGNSSLGNNKPNLKINLKTSDNETKNDSLLQMRYDDDWILSGMGNDSSYMKDMLSQYIWSCISPEYSISMKYVELVKDGEYYGLYLLSEPCDAKTFGETSKSSSFIKINDWLREQYQTDDYVVQSFENDYIINEIEISSRLSSETINQFYQEIHNIVLHDADSQLLSFDIDNLAKYQIYLNLCNAIDNTYKNQRLIVTKSNGQYTVRKGVWDCDWNFLSTYENDVVLDSLIPESISKSSDFQSLVKSKYIKARQTFYSTGYLSNILDQYETSITQSGTLIRNYNKWQDDEGYKVETGDHIQCVEILKSEINEQIAVLDEYFGYTEQEN